MEIVSTLTNSSGDALEAIYREKDPKVNTEAAHIKDVHVFGFYQDKLVIVYNQNKGYWVPPGGGIEAGETYQEAAARELKEESNMHVLRQELIGYLDIHEQKQIIRQPRVFAIIEPIGPFTGDPDGDIAQIKLIDPGMYRQYFDWGETGERIMQVAIDKYETYATN